MSNPSSRESAGDRRRQEATPALSRDVLAAPSRSPRSVIRGETPLSSTSAPPHLAHVDWLAFSLTPPTEAPIEWFKTVLEELFSIPGDCWRYDGSGWQGFAHRVDLGESGLLAFGGPVQRGRFYISLNGKACGRIHNWNAVQTFGIDTGARLKRIDLAHDDFEAETVSVDRALQWYSEGQFNLTGRPPRVRLVDDLGTNHGRTLYVGHRKNGKLCRVYEKGKELGDRQSPWTRVEVELRGQDRLIPWETVLRPGAYLAGAYPCLSFLSCEQSKIKTTQRIGEMTYDGMRKWLTNAAGRALNVMCDVEQGDTDKVMMQLVREGRPKRLRDLQLPQKNREASK